MPATAGNLLAYGRLALWASSALLFIPMVYFVAFEQPYLSYQNLPFPPQVPLVRAGEIVPLLVRRCSSAHKAQTYTMARSLQSMDSNRWIVLPDMTVRAEPGCTEGISLINAIPRETPPGHYRVIGLAEIQGTVRTMHVPWLSGEFAVVAP